MALFGIYHSCATAAWVCTRLSNADDALDLAKDCLCEILHLDLFCSKKIHGAGAHWALMGMKSSDCGDSEGGRGDLVGFKP